jgi:hypothetical protein
MPRLIFKGPERPIRPAGAGNDLDEYAAIFRKYRSASE